MGGLPRPPSPWSPSSQCRGPRSTHPPAIPPWPFPHRGLPPGPRYGDLPQVPAWRPTLWVPPAPHAEALVTGDVIGAPRPISVLAAGGFRVCAWTARPGVDADALPRRAVGPWGLLAHPRRAAWPLWSRWPLRFSVTAMAVAASVVAGLVASRALGLRRAHSRGWRRCNAWGCRATARRGGRTGSGHVAFRQASGPVSYASDRTASLSPTPSTWPIGVNGVGDRWRLGSMA
jgi:hypothetical protein